MTDRVVGLDIGASSIKAAQVLRRKDGTFVVEKQDTQPLDRGLVYDGRIDEESRAIVTAAVQDLWSRAGFATKKVVIGYNSSSAVFMREMSVPLMRPEDVAKALPLLAVAKDPTLDPEHREFSYTVIGEQQGDDGPELKVLVYSVRADYANEVGAVVDNAGLEIVGGDLNALAALRASKIYQRPANVIDAIVDIGANLTVSVLHHNGVPKMLLIDPDSAGYAATDRVADSLGFADRNLVQAEWEKINNAEPMGLVSQARSEYSRGAAAKIATGLHNYLDKSDEFKGLERVTIVGGGSLLLGLGAYLHEAIGPEVPLFFAEFDDRIKGPDGRVPDRVEDNSGGDYLVAVGLGTGARL